MKERPCGGETVNGGTGIDDLNHRHKGYSKNKILFVAFFVIFDPFIPSKAVLSLILCLASVLFCGSSRVIILLMDPRDPSIAP